MRVMEIGRSDDEALSTQLSSQLSTQLSAKLRQQGSAGEGLSPAPSVASPMAQRSLERQVSEGAAAMSLPLRRLRDTRGAEAGEAEQSSAAPEPASPATSARLAGASNSSRWSLPFVQLRRVATSGGSGPAQAAAPGDTGTGGKEAAAPLHLGVSGGLSVREMAKRLSQGTGGEAVGASPVTAGSTGRLGKVPAVQLAQRVIRQYQELMDDGTSGTAKRGGAAQPPIPTQSGPLGPAVSQRGGDGAATTGAGAGASQGLPHSHLASSAAAAGAGGQAAGAGASAGVPVGRRAGGKAAAVAASTVDGDGDGEGAVLVLDDTWMASGSSSGSSSGTGSGSGSDRE